LRVSATKQQILKDGRAGGGHLGVELKRVAGSRSTASTIEFTTGTGETIRAQFERAGWSSLRLATLPTDWDALHTIRTGIGTLDMQNCL
jgi:hypothetical protein